VSESARALRILLAAAVIHVGLFVVHLSGQYTQAKRFASATSSPGEGMVIRGDGLGYYAWLRSPLVDGDWAFENEFDQHNATRSGVPGPEERTPIGRRANPWPVGPACVWAVVVVPGHFVLRELGLGGWWIADGYTLPYQCMVGATTLALALLTLVLLFRIGRRFAAPGPAALAAALVTLASPFICYGTVETSMGHGPGTAALALAVWVWLRGFGGLGPGRWLLTGALIGVTAMMRLQLATYALLPAGEAAWLAWRARSLRPAGLLFVSAAGVVVGFTPQLVAWKVVYGSWLVEPMPLARNWLAPNLSSVLLSTDRGFFYWTPIALVGCWGLARAAGRRCPRAELVILVAALAAQVYSLAAIRGQGVFLGAAYGFRQLTEACVVLAPGLAVLLDSPGRYRQLGIVGCVLVAWNLLLIGAYRQDILPTGSGAEPAELLAAVGRFAMRRPVEWALISAGVGALIAATFGPVTGLKLKAHPLRWVGFGIAKRAS
jgi:hypothetical protein